MFFGHLKARSNFFFKESILPRFQHIDATRWNNFGDGCGRVTDARVDALFDCIMDRVGMGGGGG